MDEKVLHAAFIPFGDIIDIQIPLDYETGKPTHLLLHLLKMPVDPGLITVCCANFSEKHRGFAFIEFELAEVCEGMKIYIQFKAGFFIR